RHHQGRRQQAARPRPEAPQGHSHRTAPVTARARPAMSDTTPVENPVDALAEEFARRWRAGERPTVEEYAERHPAWADEIRDVLPGVLMMEQLKPRREDAEPAPRPAADRPPERVGDY